MRSVLTCKWLFLLGFLFLSDFISPLAAYVLPGPHLLDLMTAKSGRADRIQVLQKLLIYDSHPANAPAVVSETVRYRFPGAFRSDAASETATSIHVVAGNTALTVIDGRIAGETESLFDRYKDIMLHPTRVSLSEHLRSAGVDLTITSLGRFDGQVMYVIGAQYPDPLPAQLWIDRESFRPVRWLLDDVNRPGADRRLEVRYRNWQQHQGVWYPRQVEFYEGEQLLREIRIEQVQINPPFAEGLFDIGRIRAMYRPPPAVAPEAGETGDFHKTIEEFKKLYE